MCMLVTAGNKMAGRKTLLSELPFSNDSFLPSLPYLLVCCSTEGGGGGGGEGRSGAGGEK